MASKKGIPITCPSCGHRYSVPTEYAGRKSRCKCGETVTIPATVAKPDRSESGLNTTSVVLACSIVVVVTVCAVAFGMLWGQGKDAPRDSGTQRVTVDIHLPDARESTTAKPATTAAAAWSPPFEYEVVKHDTAHKFGPASALQHSFRVETTVDVAKLATESDLREIWQNDFAAKAGENTWAFVDFYVPTPGAGPWANINRLPDGEYSIKPTSWRMGFCINDYNIDPEPNHFVERIDRSVSWQQAMVVDLPAANRIRERLTQAGFETSSHTVSQLSLDLPPTAMNVLLTPDGINVSNLWRRNVDNERLFWSTCETVLSEIEIWNQVRQRSQAIIGSPEYFKGDSWNWEIGDYEVRYLHSDTMDDLDVMFRRK